MSSKHSNTRRDRVLVALQRFPEGLSKQQILEGFGYPENTVVQILNALLKEGVVKTDTSHGRPGKYVFVPEENREPVIESCLQITMDKSTILHRIVMVKRLRDRLIEEHHYILNRVIRDYENMMLCYGEDVDDSF